jgi:Myb-like DNA-binding domain
MELEGMSSSGRNPGDEDYDSDVLADSSSDDGDCSIDKNSKSCNLTGDYDDDEEYGNFLRSVFCENNGTKSPLLFSDDDEEDEEEYRPLCIDSNDDDDDDEEDDDGLIKVARKELVDLVDGCWQTIAGEPVQITAQTADGPSSQKGRGVKRKSSKLSVTGKSVTGESIDDDQCPEDEPNSGVNIPMSFSRDSDGPSKVLSPRLSNDYVPYAEIGAHQSTYSNVRSKALGQQTSGQSLISNLVRQIFSGEKPSAVCLDGMPVDAIRKLVARQMSMASQLLVQMLLSAEDRSLCFNTCYTSLMELSNYRERALKKATLLQMNMKNLRVAAFQKISPVNQSAGINSCRPHQSSNNIDTSPAEMRLTRAVAGRQSKALGSSARSTSLFDLPMLLDITELFETIDLSRREIKAHIASSASHSSVSPCTIDGATSSTRFGSPADTLFRSRAAALMALKSQMQRTSPFSSSSRTVSALTKTRVWECLVPSPNSPLGEDLMVGTDPSSLMGRSLFTPAEDDLLLRGIIKHGEDAWKLIRQDFLPSKEEQLLQFRFRQMTSPSAKEASKFKR